MTRWRRMLLGPTLIGPAVCNLMRIACLEVEDRDPAHVPVGSLTMEGDPLPIGRPRRIVVIPALGRVGDLADMAPIGVHREERPLSVIGIEPAPKDDLPVGGSSATALALVVLSSTATLSRVLSSTGGQ